MMKEVEEAKCLERQKHMNLLVHLLILFDLRSLNCLYYHFYFFYPIIYFAFLLLKTFFKLATQYITFILRLFLLDFQVSSCFSLRCICRET